MKQHEKSQFSKAFRAATPIMVGYFPIGIAFGVYAVSSGLAWYWPLLIGLVLYSGAAQFLLVALLAQGTPGLAILGTLVVLNMRHLFYGLPFLGSLPTGRLRRFLAIFWLTDEVYSVLTSQNSRRDVPMHLVGGFSYSAWNIGCLTGGLLGTALAIPQASLTFSLTTLFLILLLEQWRNHRTMLPIGVAIVVWLLVSWLGVSWSLGFQLMGIMIAIMIALALLHWAIWRMAQKEKGGTAND